MTEKDGKTDARSRKKIIIAVALGLLIAALAWRGYAMYYGVPDGDPASWEKRAEAVDLSVRQYESAYPGQRQAFAESLASLCLEFRKDTAGISSADADKGIREASGTLSEDEKENRGSAFTALRLSQGAEKATFDKDEFKEDIELEKMLILPLGDFSGPEVERQISVVNAMLTWARALDSPPKELWSPAAIYCRMRAFLQEQDRGSGGREEQFAAERSGSFFNLFCAVTEVRPRFFYIVAFAGEWENDSNKTSLEIRDDDMIVIRRPDRGSAVNFSVRNGAIEFDYEYDAGKNENEVNLRPTADGGLSAGAIPGTFYRAGTGKRAKLDAAMRQYLGVWVNAETQTTLKINVQSYLKNTAGESGNTFGSPDIDENGNIVLFKSHGGIDGEGRLVFEDLGVFILKER